MALKRREFLTTAVATGVSAAIPAALGSREVSRLSRTPSDYEGPFYPRGPRHETNDLIVGEPRTDALQLEGSIRTVDGEPRAGALVDIWQADPEGRYSHPADQSDGRRWEEFLYWGEARTDANGRFSFRTYLPGAYTQRPAPHIHYKVWDRKQQLLTSQIYFEELGGPRGLARSDVAGRLQTVQLQRHEDLYHAVAIIVV